MSTFSQFVGGAATTSIVNYYSSGGVSSGSTLSSGNASNSKKVLSGALTANTLATILSVSGGGEVPLLFAAVEDATSRTLRVRVTVDGTVVYDATTSAITTLGHGQVVAGQVADTSYVAASASGIRFNASLLVEIASSLSETNKVSLSYALNKR